MQKEAICKIPFHSQGIFVTFLAYNLHPHGGLTGNLLTMSYAMEDKGPSYTALAKEWRFYSQQKTALNYKHTRKYIKIHKI